MCLLAIYMSSLEKYLFSSLAYFLNGSIIFLELSWRSCLYIFEINPLSVASFAIIFSQPEGLFSPNLRAPSCNFIFHSVFLYCLYRFFGVFFNSCYSVLICWEGILICLKNLLEYSCFTCCVSFYLQQNEPVFLYINPLFFGFPPHLGHHTALSRDPCAVEQALISYLLYTE